MLTGQQQKPLRLAGEVACEDGRQLAFAAAPGDALRRSQRRQRPLLDQGQRDVKLNSFRLDQQCSTHDKWGKRVRTDNACDALIG